MALASLYQGLICVDEVKRAGVVAEYLGLFALIESGKRVRFQGYEAVLFTTGNNDGRRPVLELAPWCGPSIMKYCVGLCDVNTVSLR